MIGEDCVGFLFDGEITKTERCVNIHGRSIRFLSIDDDPGHVQSGHYLWPGLVHVADYLIERKDEFLSDSGNGSRSDGIDGIVDGRIARVLELGSGTGVLSVALAPFAQSITASDHDPAALQLIQRNVQLNQQFTTPQAHIDVVPLEWGVDSGIAERFGLVVGSDLIYTETVVQPLFHTVHELMEENGIFVLGASFNIGEAAEREIEQQCEKYKLTHERLELNPESAAHPVIIHICRSQSS